MKYRTVSENEVKNIWTENHFRIFLSHKSSCKKEAAELKQNLEKYGISAFVAHEDIESSTDWQNELENALLSMDAFVALITEDFYESEWTSQEIGFSYAFDIPRIFVNLNGGNPKGFARKIQALKCIWDTAPKKIFKDLLKFDKAINHFIGNLKNISDFCLVNELYDILITLDLNDEQYNEIIFAYNNTKIGENYKFRSGIITYLNKRPDKQYKLDETNKIVEINNDIDNFEKLSKLENGGKK